MEDKSCRNCFCFNRCLDLDENNNKFMLECKQNNLINWKPDYYILESELSEKNDIIDKLMHRVTGAENAVQRMMDELRSCNEELEQYKEALRLMVKASLCERYERPLEEDIKKEIDWFMDKAKSNLSMKV
jgi:uncharacterized coiled-coil protein SlyX